MPLQPKYSLRRGQLDLEHALAEYDPSWVHLREIQEGIRMSNIINDALDKIFEPPPGNKSEPHG